MHHDHNIFTKAIQEKKKVKLTFYGSESNDTKEGILGPILYSNSLVGGDSDCYYLWDFESEDDKKFIGLPPSRIASMKLSEEPFDLAEFFTSKRVISAEKTQSETERRSSEQDRRCSTAPYDGPERRSGKDRRYLP